MANLPTAAPAARGIKPRAKKHAFHLDMTPMVDLAFLLLTFFMLTTTFSKPTVMQVAMPVKGPETPVSELQSLTLLLDKNQQVHYFFGLNPGPDAAGLRTTTFAADGLRQVLLGFRARQPEGVVLIKPTDESTYQNMVDALDEMNITDQKKYALVELSAADKALLTARAL
ncbi:biopolymer transporter ExbD [Hymenobacter sp. NST-14]|uniref:ExbD/TolR family protein n=1 Tax=Hymenobacter piscis TaxID=2839984 RepID=UPI001C025B92|nr:biopolymer transporter ExbD [Hymenobacter piscis]MBT9391987.1 biopolymer transporter ExbD [Hymenobacter piscis]